MWIPEPQSIKNKKKKFFPSFFISYSSAIQLSVVFFFVSSLPCNIIIPCISIKVNTFLINNLKSFIQYYTSTYQPIKLMSYLADVLSIYYYTLMDSKMQALFSLLYYLFDVVVSVYQCFIPTY